MSIDEKQSSELARWMGGDRSTLPPEEASVAIWAIRPDLAPSPTVTIDNVLDRVRTGVFASSPVTEASVEDVEFVSTVFSNHSTDINPTTSIEDVLSNVESGPFSQNTSVEESAANNNRWWNSSWIGGGVAVALVLIILLPNKFVNST